jgi:hypothetical protein
MSCSVEIKEYAYHVNELAQLTGTQYGYYMDHKSTVNNVLWKFKKNIYIFKNR